MTQQRKTTRGAGINPTEGCEKVVALCGLLLRGIFKEDIQDSQQRFSVIKPRKKKPNKQKNIQTSMLAASVKRV